MELRLVTIPAIIAVFSVIIIGLSLQLDTSPPMIVGDSMQPRSFPIFLMVLNLILTAALALQFYRHPPKDQEPILKITWLTMVLMVVFYALTVSIDMFVGISVVMFLMSLIWGQRSVLIAAANAILTPFLVFLLFDVVLRIRFPRGVITNWYYG